MLRAGGGGGGLRGAPACFRAGARARRIAGRVAGMFPAVRAVTVQGGHLVVEDRPDPEPGVGEVLVRVRGAGINGADMLQRRGAYPAPPGSPPDIPGLELAGEVVGRGPGATRFEEGDRVMAIVGGGGEGGAARRAGRPAGPGP